MATNEFKRSLYRILTDLAKYDSVISSEELDIIDSMEKDYNITQTDKTES